MFQLASSLAAATSLGQLRPSRGGGIVASSAAAAAVIISKGTTATLRLEQRSAATTMTPQKSMTEPVVGPLELPFPGRRLCCGLSNDVDVNGDDVRRRCNVIAFSSDRGCKSGVVATFGGWYYHCPPSSYKTVSSQTCRVAPLLFASSSLLYRLAPPAASAFVRAALGGSSSGSAAAAASFSSSSSAAAVGGDGRGDRRRPAPPPPFGGSAEGWVSSSSYSGGGGPPPSVLPAAGSGAVLVPAAAESAAASLSPTLPAADQRSEPVIAKVYRWLDVTGMLTRWNNRKEWIMDLDSFSRIGAVMMTEFERKLLMFLGFHAYLFSILSLVAWAQAQSHFGCKPPCPKSPAYSHLDGRKRDFTWHSKFFFMYPKERCKECRWLEPDCKKECFERLKREGHTFFWNGGEPLSTPRFALEEPHHHHH